MLSPREQEFRALPLLEPTRSSRRTRSSILAALFPNEGPKPRASDWLAGVAMLFAMVAVGGFLWTIGN